MHGSRYGKCCEISSGIVLFLFPLEMKLEGALKVSQQISRHAFPSREFSQLQILNFMAFSFCRRLSLRSRVYTAGPPLSLKWSFVSDCGPLCSEGALARKSTLRIDESVDQNFQTNLGAIGPYEFQGNFVWTALLPCFQGNSYGPMALKLLQKFALRLALVHGRVTG